MQAGQGSSGVIIPMSEIKRISTGVMMPVIRKLLENDKRVRITVTGNSMYPFLRENKDSVELITCSFPGIRSGDIILIQRDDSAYVLHRVIFKKKEHVYINGDAQRSLEGPIRRDQILAKVNTVWREGAEISVNNIVWKVLAFLWFCILPFRKTIIFRYHKFRSIQRKYSN
jgi:hypothetical protein